ncbi:MAG: beta-propeller fold lactonase family protein [Acidobacteria bacterium]|nr:beta-propeller fold lactonase family protein [Acidobacteriota bacterium]
MLVLLAGCRRGAFPEYPANYREFAYVTNGAANTVTVLDLVYLRQDKVLQVGQSPSGIAVNPVRNEVYVANAGSGTITVINTELNRIEATIGVQRGPYSIAVSHDGKRAYTANSGSNSVSVIDLDTRRQIAVVGAGEKPGVVVVAPDDRAVVITNRESGSVSVYAVSTEQAAPPLKLRSTWGNCPEATDALIIKDSTKVFVTCSANRQVMAVWLAADPNEWRGKQDPSLQRDAFLTMLDVGDTPMQITMKPDGGEIFVSNFNSNTISEISTWTNEVSNTFPIGPHPVHGVIGKDNTFWVSNFGADMLSLYSIDDGKRVGSVRSGTAPDALAFSRDEHLLLAANSKSGDVAVIRTVGRNGQPELFTMLPTGAQPNAIGVKSFSVK